LLSLTIGSFFIPNNYPPSLLRILCQIVKGFGANLLAYDVFEADCVKEMGGKYVSKEEIYKTCDIIFLMMPLLPATKHTINSDVLPLLKKGVIIINTSRGGLIETSALLDGIQSGIIGGAGIDVYENEGEFFFQDWSARNIDDPVLVALLGSNKVVMTAHQAFFTREAIDKIVGTTMNNITEYNEGLRGKDLTNNV
jgi:D-lactate dehydrogenase